MSTPPPVVVPPTREMSPGPLLLSVTLLAVMVPSVMSSEAKTLLPAPVPSVMTTLPVPALIAVPVVMVRAAAPGPRSLSTTPSAAVSLAISVRLPLPVVMLAVMRILRPAWRVRSPPLPDGLLTVIALETVMSLLACKTTAVPVSSVAVRKLGVSVSDAVAAVA